MRFSSLNLTVRAELRSENASLVLSPSNQQREVSGLRAVKHGPPRASADLVRVALAQSPAVTSPAPRGRQTLLLQIVLDPPLV